MTDKDSAMDRGTPPFLDYDNDDDNDDTDNEVEVKGGDTMAFLYASAAWHRRGERERMRWF